MNAIALLLAVISSILAERMETIADVWASVPGREDVVLKFRSVHSQNYSNAPAESARPKLSSIIGKDILRAIYCKLGMEKCRDRDQTECNALI